MHERSLIDGGDVVPPMQEVGCVGVHVVEIHGVPFEGNSDTVDLRWVVNQQLDGTAVSVFWPLPSGLASSPLKYTPAADMIKWAPCT